MKIAIATHFPAVQNAPQGGVEAVSVNLVKGLAQLQDMEIHVVTLDTTITANSISHWDNVTIHRLAVSPGSILLQACGAWKHTLQNYLINLQPDLVHSHDTYGIMTQGLRIPRVFTIHGFIYGDTLLSQNKMAWLRSKIWKFFETRAWAEQPHIISISPYVRERLTGIAKGVICDIDNPVAEDFFHVQRAEKQGTIFSAAVISPRKNTLTLVKAFALIADEFPHANLRLAGTIIDNDYAQLIKEYILKMKLSDRVLFLGKIGTSQMLDELAAASIFALVSLEENSPMGIEEAMAVGVPVVTSNRCGMPYMVQHGGSGYLVNPEQPSEIASRFQTLLANNPLRTFMGNIGNQIAIDRFHPLIIVRRTQQTYFEILQDKQMVSKTKDR
ncbi:MAG: glycosyltransferase family 4 protein [Chlorobium sp.]|nr:glycosyltransferase family 4 protein [Chlorobium sp.]